MSNDGMTELAWKILELASKREWVTHTGFHAKAMGADDEDEMLDTILWMEDQGLLDWVEWRSAWTISGKGKKLWQEK